jgi:selenocysteine lyase/cysteine desulfurase
LTPLDGADPQKVLRISPHVDSATEDLEAFAEALAEATELPS